MNPYSIFFPVMALVALANFVVLRLGYLRRKAMVEKRADWNTNKYTPPIDHSQACVTNRNFANLFEMPVLFYTVSIILFVTQKTDSLFIILAWAYVGLRYVHSAVHLTFNYVPVRFTVYALSNLTLLAVWIRLFVIFIK